MKHSFDFSSRFRILKGGKISMVVSALLAGSTMSFAAPSGGVVNSGSATIAQKGSVTTINQNTQRASINWQSFGIGASESVNFNQPNSSAVALNRVVGNESSVINGALNANGKVWILNSNGVLFGKNASVNTAGLVASTMNITDQNFMNGNYVFESTGSKASVINMGTIRTTDGGYVALLGKDVANSGLIQATKGTVALAAGDKISLNFNGDSLVSIAIDQGTLDALVENKGAIIADGGRIFLTTKAADSLLNGVVNNTGLLQAQTLDDITGYIEVYAHGGTANIAGSIKAEGGFVETSGKKVKISDDFRVSAKNWLIDPTDFTIAASGGDMTGAALSANLGTTDVTIQSSLGGSGTNGDIIVNDNISWNADHTLTLNAYRNININSVITATGANGKVALEYGQGAVAAGNTATYGFGLTNTAHGATGNNFTGQINLQVGSNFSTKLGSDGAVTNYTVITALGSAGDETSNPANSLQGLANSANLAGNFVLGANINANATSGWNGGAGFVPIGDNAVKFTGKFDGLGHSISGLFVNRPAVYKQSLFGDVQSATIGNIGIVNASISGKYYVGGLVGNGNNGVIKNSYSAGTITATVADASNGSDNGMSVVGGLVGSNFGGTLTDSYSTATATGQGMYVGGLVGSSYNGTIANSHATGLVDGGTTASYVGGLAGRNKGAVTNSYATGNVSGATVVGGLVGNSLSGSSITDSYATGNVSGTGDSIGGLSGYNEVAITNSYATGTVSGHQYIGGLAGRNAGGTISNSYATGAVTGSFDDVGGLVGNNNPGTISNSYATGNVTGQSVVGGLVGGNGGTITNSHATGVITGNGTDKVGGLVGGNSGAVSYAYATGDVTGATVTRIGGLIGFNNTTGSIHDAYANGSVTGVGAGGLVGANSGSVTNAYATGAVSGSSSAGGLVGNNAGTLTNTYSIGAVSGVGTKGGLAGVNSGTVNNSFWDAQTSGQSASAGGTSKTTEEMKTLSTFTSAGWDMVSTTSQTYTGHPYGGLSMGGANVWMLTPPAAPTPTPTPSVNNDTTTTNTVTTTPAAPQTQLVHNDSVLGNVIASTVTPVAPQPPRMDAKVSSNTGIVVKSDMAPVISKGFTEGTTVDLVSKPLTGEPTQSLSLSDVKAMQQSKGSADGSGVAGGQEIRVAVSHENTIISLVNGGVKLPRGVEQEFYVINVENKAAQ